MVKKVGEFEGIHLLEGPAISNIVRPGLQQHFFEETYQLPENHETILAVL